MREHIITSYPNPDTDGVACMVAYADYMRRTSQMEITPIYCGRLQPETAFVLQHLGIPYPIPMTTLPAASQFTLVDTHHVLQLPDGLQPGRVVRIIDHHPAGNPDLFPMAAITNQTVGAAATLVAECFRGAGLQPDKPIAGLLRAAIASNTIDFQTATTTESDREVARWLELFCPEAGSPAFLQAMFAARRELGDLPTVDLVAADYKEFSFGDGRVGIAQIEVNDAEHVIGRADLIDAMGAHQRARRTQHGWMNVVDITAKRSIVVAIDAETQALLSEAIGAAFGGFLARFDRMLSRKRDFIPGLERVKQLRHGRP